MAEAVRGQGPVLLEEPGFLGREGVDDRAHVLAKLVEVGHLADDGVDPLVVETALMAAWWTLKPFSIRPFIRGVLLARLELARRPPGSSSRRCPRLAFDAALTARLILSPSIVRKLYWIIIWSTQPASAAASTSSGSIASWQEKPANLILPDFFSSSKVLMTSWSREDVDVPAADPVDVVAVEVVGLEPFEAGLEVGAEGP